MRQAVKFIIIGYLSGSILFARICAKLLDKPGILQESKDGNPGTVNAFKYGGFLCGMITLIGDLAKGFFPVFAYLKCGGAFTGISLITALVLAAPRVRTCLSDFFPFSRRQRNCCYFRLFAGRLSGAYAIVGICAAVCFLLCSIQNHAAFYAHNRDLYSYAALNYLSALYIGTYSGLWNYICYCDITPTYE